MSDKVYFTALTRIATADHLADDDVLDEIEAEVATQVGRELTEQEKKTVGEAFESILLDLRK